LSLSVSKNVARSPATEALCFAEAGLLGVQCVRAAFMIESIMYFGLGFCLAGLTVLIVVPLVHGRAVRLTIRQLETSIPSSLLDVMAEKDLQRAEFAMSTRRLERNAEQLKIKGAGQLAELGRKSDAINRLKIALGALRDRLRASEENSAVKANAAHEAERALSEKESELAKLASAFDERSVLADTQKAEIVALTGQVQTLKEQLTRANKEARAAEDHDDAAVRAAERALSEKESELAKLTSAFDKHLVLADSQKAEIVTLTGQVRTFKEQLTQAGLEARAAEDHRAAARIELKTAIEKLTEERVRFEHFHGRVAELVRQVVARTTEDKILTRRAQEGLESRLLEQSQALNEREGELKHLRREIEIARKTEFDVRIAMIEIDGRANAAAQNFKAENARLQAALERANGERVRLTYELANIKRLAKETQAA
jgi:hypothetical protein